MHDASLNVSAESRSPQKFYVILQVGIIYNNKFQSLFRLLHCQLVLSFLWGDQELNHSILFISSCFKYTTIACELGKDLPTS